MENNAFDDVKSRKFCKKFRTTVDMVLFFENKS